MVNTHTAVFLMKENIKESDLLSNMLPEILHRFPPRHRAMLCIPTMLRQRRIPMHIKVIYEDDALLPIKESISKLDSAQLFFVELYIRTLKQQRQDTIFDQWLCTMQTILNKHS